MASTLSFNSLRHTYIFELCQKPIVTVYSTKFINELWNPTNILLENHVTNRVKKHLLMRKDTALSRGFLVKHFLPAFLEVQQIDVLEKPVRFLTICLKAKLITSEKLFSRNLYGMVVYKVLESKAEIDLAFFDTDFIQLSGNWKIILRSPEFIIA